MRNIERLRFYATAPRAGAKQIHQIEDGDFVPYWLATLRGKAVTLKAGEHKHHSRDDALRHAREFRAACQRDLAELEAAGSTNT